MYLIIPAYEPDDRLVTLVKDLKRQLPSAKLIVVNDGSGSLYDHYYQTIQRLGALVLTHPKNLGKGAALKTAFSYIGHQELDDVMVTVDSDGQHLIKDIVAVAKVSQEEPDKLILGSRAFVGNVPARSRFGNKVTATLFSLVTGQKISDTQTGLRGFSTKQIPWLLNLEGDRFEYEFNMLLEANKEGHLVKEVPIETVYLEDNQSSHFRPIQDSIRIYAPFLKFSGTAVLATLVDLFGLFVLMHLTDSLLLSIVLSRVFSATVQCLLNAKLVFHHTGYLFKSMVRYTLLAVTLLACNYFMIKSLVAVGLGLLLAKLITETILFILSYRFQNTYVFS